MKFCSGNRIKTILGAFPPSKLINEINFFKNALEYSHVPVRMNRIDPIHVTMCYIKPIEKQEISKCISSVNQIELPSFSFKITGIDFWPPALIVLNLVPCFEAKKANYMLTTSLSNEGFGVAFKNDFKPHITVGTIPRESVSEYWGVINKLCTVKDEYFKVKRIEMLARDETKKSFALTSFDSNQN